jgi:hypothetical protein
LKLITVLSAIFLLTTSQQESNEPPGMKRLTETGFNCVNGCGEWGAWDQQYGNAATVAADLNAPKSPSAIVQMNYTPALRPGWAPMSFAPKQGSLPEVQTIYVAIWLKLSSNYQGHSSGVNKVLHFFTHGESSNNIAIFNIRGGGSEPLVPGFLFQRLATVPREINLDAPPGICTVHRGQWAHYEMVLESNTPGVPNGVATLWMNGSKCVEKRNVTFVAHGQINKWEQVWWSPTWGGAGGPRPATSFYEQVDHLYVSGK